MTEEHNIPIAPPTVGRPPMEYYFRLTTVDNRTFVGECKKIAKEKSMESISAVIALVLMGANRKTNDPYVLDSKSRSKGGFEIKGSKPREEKKK